MVQLITHLRSVVWPFTQMSSWKATSTNYDLFLHVFSLSSNPQRWEWLHPTLQSLGSSGLKCGISSGCNFSSYLVLMPARVKPLLCPCLQHFGTQESSIFLSIETMTLAILKLPSLGTSKNTAEVCRVEYSLEACALCSYVKLEITGSVGARFNPKIIASCANKKHRSR